MVSTGAVPCTEVGVLSTPVIPLDWHRSGGEPWHLAFLDSIRREWMSDTLTPLTPLFAAHARGAAATI